MEEYLQHLNSLRMQLRDREAREDALAAEEHKYRAAISASEKDLEQVHAELDLNITELDRIKRDRVRLADMILSCRKSLQSLDAQTEILEQAFELLRTAVQKQVIAVGEKRSSYDAKIDGIISKKQEYENCYKSRPLEMDICKVQAELDELAKDPEPLMTAEQPQVSEPTSIVGTDEPEKPDKLEDLARDWEAVTAEFEKEHEYLETLKGHAEQLQVPGVIVCRSCGHAYGVDLRGAHARKDSPKETGGTSK